MGQLKNIHRKIEKTTKKERKNYEQTSCKRTEMNGKKDLTIKTFGGSSPSIVTNHHKQTTKKRKIRLSFIFTPHFRQFIALPLCAPTIAENSNPNQCQTRYKLREIANFLIELVCASFFSRRRRRIFPLFCQRAHPLKKDCAVHFL